MIGVLLMAHGTPSSLDEMPEYLRLVRGGRPPSPELVEEMRHNYQAIGGRSPLTAITLEQADLLQSRVGEVPVVVGMRNWHPFIADAVGALHALRVTRVLGIPLAPQFSTLSVQKYIDTARGALRPSMSFDAVKSFHAHPLLLDAFAARVREAAPQDGEVIIFTAHSLPARVIEEGDPYVDEVMATAKGVAARVGIARFDIGYQSAGRMPEPWIGPTLDELIKIRAAGGAKTILVAPIGFVCDHTEILFDIDVQAALLARESGASLRRIASLNTSPAFIDLLEALVRPHL